MGRSRKGSRGQVGTARRICLGCYEALTARRTVPAKRGALLEVLRTAMLGDVITATENSKWVIRHIYISPGHNFFGRHGKGAGGYPMIEQQKVQCTAGRGIVGDRFFDFKPDYSGQITFFAEEIYERLCGELKVQDKPPFVFRRNVITRGVDLNSLIGRDFEIQGIRFRGKKECTPCHWMDHAFAPGAEKFLQGNGGLRAVILNDGELRVDVP